MRIGLMVGPGSGGTFTIDGLLKQYHEAESAGFASAWTANIFSHDAIMVLAMAGAHTSQIELGTFVVPTYPRHPTAMAQQALTAAEATDGRFILGIGLSHKVVIENMFGLDYSKPVRHMREYLSVLQPLLEQKPVQFQGEEFRVAAQMQVPAAKKPPVIIAALGPQMLKVAGTLADGTATWMGGPKYLEKDCIPAIRAAAKEAGRPEPRIVAGFPISLTTKVDAARAAAAQTFAVYGQLPSYRAALDKEGAAGAQDVAIVGSEEEVQTQLRRLRDIGVTDLTASPYGVPDDPAATGRTIEFLASLSRNGL